jgi:hypothetical protein
LIYNEKDNHKNIGHFLFVHGDDVV